MQDNIRVGQRAARDRHEVGTFNQAGRSHNQHERQTDAPTLAWGLSLLNGAIDTSIGSGRVVSGSYAEVRRGNDRSGVYAGERKQAWASSQLIRRSLPVLHEIIKIHPPSTPMSFDLDGRPSHFTHQIASPASET